LLRVEQEKMELETEKSGLHTTIEIAESNIEQLKTEIQYLSKEKVDVTDHLNAVSTLWFTGYASLLRFVSTNIH